jgi:hypothetical protein
MRLCILCEDSNITDARERATTVLPQLKLTEGLLELKKKKGEDISLDHLKIPLSSTGELPATHWFCFINVNEAMHQNMLASQLYTIIGEDRVPSEFLAEHGLKRIKSSWGK